MNFESQLGLNAIKRGEKVIVAIREFDPFFFHCRNNDKMAVNEREAALVH